MHISPKEIENWVRANFDVRDGIKELKICNPFQELETGTPDTKFHMNVNLKKGLVHDWRPHHQNHDGPFVNFVMAYLQCDYRAAVRNIKSAKHANITSYLETPEEDGDEEIIVGDLELPPGSKEFKPDGEKRTMMETMVLNYLIGRCVTLEKIKKWGVMYAVSKVVFPYIEYGEVAYWQTRDTDSKRFEFPDASTGVLKTSFLYGWDRADHKSDLFVTESLFGAISIGDGGLASGGATLDLKQIMRLKVFSPIRVILCPDNDEAGTTSIYQNRMLMHGIFDDVLYYCQPPLIKDQNGNNIKDWNDFHILCMFFPNLVPQEYAKRDDCVKLYINKHAKKLTKEVAIKLRLTIKKQPRDRMKFLKILEGN